MLTGSFLRISILNSTRFLPLGFAQIPLGSKHKTRAKKPAIKTRTPVLSLQKRRSTGVYVYRISETVDFFRSIPSIILSARFSKPLQIIRHVLIFDAVFKLSVFSAVNNALSGDWTIAVFQRPASIRILQNMILPRYNDIAVFDLVGFAVKAFR